MSSSGPTATGSLNRGTNTLTSLFGLRKPLPWVVFAIILYTVAGFLLLPWIAKDQLPKVIKSDYGLDATVEDIRVNPWLLTVEITNFSIDDPDSQELLGFERLFVNLQTSSIFNWAITLKELSVDNVHLDVLRYSFDDTNLQRAMNAAPASEAATETTESSKPLRLLIYEISIRGGTLNIEDRLPTTPFATSVGPVDISINELNTLPGRSGQQQVSIVTETGAKVSWNGSLELAPLVTAGNLSIKGPLLPTLHRYVEDNVTFSLSGGALELELDYQLLTTANGDLSFAADNINIALRNTVLNDISSGEQLLHVPEIIATNGSVRYPENNVHFDVLAGNDIAINSWINPTNELNFAQLLRPASDATEPAQLATDKGSESPEKPWAVSLSELQVNRLNMRFEDRSLKNTAQLDIANFDLNIKDISNTEGAIFPFTSMASLQSGGTADVKGTLTVLPEPIVKADLNITALNLSGAQAYVDEFAQIDIESGQLNMAAALTSDSEEQLAVRGTISIDNLITRDTLKDKKLLDWKQLLIDDVALNLSAETLEASKVRLEQPYVRLVIAEDATNNFNDVINIPTAQAPQPETEAEPSAFQVQIGEIDVRNGNADFTDRSLPLPFSASIAKLEGDFSTVSTASLEPTVVDLKGQVDQYGTARIAGELYVFDPLSYSDLSVVFKNLNMPTLTPYTVEFVGRKIESGKLDVDLSYKFNNQQMLGSNSVVISEFTLGEKVDSENAVSLPLGLAVALLKDKDGVIDVNLEVAGDMSDPDFSVAGIVLKALGNLITKIATSPFRALGGLVGGDDLDLESLQFEPGSAELTPPDKEKLVKLAQALEQRPELSLIIPQTLAPQIDKVAMQTSAVEIQINTQMSEKLTRDESPDMFIRRQRKVLEKLYTVADPEGSLKSIKLQYTRPLAEGERAKLDEVAYSAELKRQLIALESVDNDELEQLAASRATVAIDEILRSANTLNNRLQIGDNQLSESKDPQRVEMIMKIEIAEPMPASPETTSKEAS